MNQNYTQEERKKILNTMSTEQREFLMTTLKRGRATAFANALIKTGEDAKNTSDESLLFSREKSSNTHTEWELIEIIDAGQIDSNLKCECGRPLRYQYIVKNRRTEALLKLGKNHLTMHMGIPDNIAQAVIKNIMKIDFELDEILGKYADKQHLNRRKNLDNYWSQFLFLFDDDIVEQYELGIPFLNKQIKKLQELVSEYNKQKNIENTWVEPQKNSNQSQIKLFEDDISFDLNNNQEEQTHQTIHTEIKDDSHWASRMEIRKAIQSSNTYRYDLFEDIMVLLKNDVNSANSIVDVLLNNEKYQHLFAKCTRRMCYLIVTSRITEAKLSGEPITRESISDRTDTYYFLNTINI